MCKTHIKEYQGVVFLSKNRILNVQGAVLDKYQLEQYLEKMASDHILKNKSKRDTYPVPRLNENYQFIKSVYKLLNDHIKEHIPIHPAGEWILDNFYIVEEIAKNISKELTIKKYIDFVSVTGGRYDGFARIYIVAAEMVAFTDGVIDDKNLEDMLKSYQNKKKLSMDEIWNIGLFIQISLIEKIRQICEKIYYSQIQKSKVEEIISNTIDRGKKVNLKDNFGIVKPHLNLSRNNHLRHAFVEYMSYKLKKYGRSAYPYLKILENEVNKAGTTVDDIIKKEHFDVAVKKVSIGNSITSLKEISRINFLEIFEKINGVEDVLNEDPANEYSKMNAESKAYYRNAIKEIAKKTKLSEIYIANKCLELTKNAKNTPQNHIGYYLVSEGRMKLINSLTEGCEKNLTNYQKSKLYITIIFLCTIILSSIVGFLFYKQLDGIINSNLKDNLLFNDKVAIETKKILLSLLLFLIIMWPIHNAIAKITQYVLSKLVKPKLIPKLDFQSGIPQEYATFVVIPTILKNSDQVRKLMKKLEVYYISNKSDNIYFALLGDCSSSSKEIEDFDDEVINSGIIETKRLNDKYTDEVFNKFNFIYRKRIWNDKEDCYLGWERKRGLLDQFNEYILGKIDSPFRINTIENEKRDIPKIKYVITLDSDTDLTLNSGIELIGAMAHCLNKPILNKEKDLVVAGHGILAPRVGISLEDSKINAFTALYAGQGGTDSYTNAVSDFYQDNFDEGIYAGKGIYDLETFSMVLNGEIKENTVLSHDLLEGSYMRAGYISDVMLMDGYPSNYLAERKRLYRWMRGDWQVTLWLKKRIQDKNGNTKRNPLNMLSKYKILSNILRSKQEEKILEIIFFLISLKLAYNVKIGVWLIITFGIAGITTILDLINWLVYRNGDSVKTKSFESNIHGILASLYRLAINIGNLPDRAYISLKSQFVTIHRMKTTKKHLLEWETSEEAEKNSLQSVKNYYRTMICNPILGIIGLVTSLIFINTNINVFIMGISIIWLISPLIMYKISKKEKEVKAIDTINEKDKKFLDDLGYRTWRYFKDNLVKENNYLPPDNYQEDRTPKLVPRTSSTNIGLAFLAVISSYDMGYENLENTVNLIYNMSNVVYELQKWNGHLYNWYDIKTLQPLSPKFVSSVDSGNFVGYMYVLLQFLYEAKEKIIQYNAKKDCVEKVNRSITEERDLGDDSIEKINYIIKQVNEIIKYTDFSKLYDKKTRLFSVRI